MATFVLNQPIVTAEPGIVVENQLKPGSYRFRLVVVDNDGNQSAPSERVVVVRLPIIHTGPIIGNIGHIGPVGPISGVPGAIGDPQ